MGRSHQSAPYHDGLGTHSAFNAVYTGLYHQDILLNGRGNLTKYSGLPNSTTIKDPYSIHFDAPKKGFPIKKYLLRIINTSFDSTFVFSIDNHNLTIISTDFVPITPYSGNSVLVGIGQRYNVIVEANPIAYNSSNKLPTDGNYWIRTYVSPCGPGQPDGKQGYERTGVLRYGESKSLPTTVPPDNIPKDCSDEDYTNLHPIWQWTIDTPKNGEGEDFNLLRKFPKPGPEFPLAHWALSDSSALTPLCVSYEDPTFFHFAQKGNWNPLWRIVPENYHSEDWVYLVIEGLNHQWGAHPIHLHGHDFAILEQAYNKTFNHSTVSLKLDNPPRRDVVLMPANGYVVIAFRADNPGAWLVHCHIAFHISGGLGLQILERQDDANRLWPKISPAIREAVRVCAKWDAWHGNKQNWYNKLGVNCTETDTELCFQDDSGV